MDHVHAFSCMFIHFHSLPPLKLPIIAPKLGVNSQLKWTVRQLNWFQIPLLSSHHSGSRQAHDVVVDELQPVSGYQVARGHASGSLQMVVQESRSLAQWCPVSSNTSMFNGCLHGGLGWRLAVWMVWKWLSFIILIPLFPQKLWNWDKLIRCALW